MKLSDFGQIFKGAKALYNIGLGVYELTHPDYANYSFFYDEVYSEQIDTILSKLSKKGKSPQNITESDFINEFNNSKIFEEMLLTSFAKNRGGRIGQEARLYASEQHKEEYNRLYDLGDSRSLTEKQKIWYGETLYRFYCDKRKK